MSFKSFDWGSSVIVYVSSSLFIFLLFLCAGIYSTFLSGVGLIADLFVVDMVSLYLALLSCLLWVSLWFWFEGLSGLVRVMISLSVVCSLLCYCCVHSVWFWVFYELSIIPLLVLLVVESPYSERYVASWYLLGYVVFTSLPMLLCIFYLSSVWGVFNMSLWGSMAGSTFIWCLVLLAFLFITKIPLPPFHTWLPVVHAEASSPVSVCLSGYIMKLGVLGVCRFCFFLLPDSIFLPEYSVLCFGVSVLFFFSATRELDGKRWLAFLSLSHILVALGCLSIGGWLIGGPVFLYCVGHGFSAGLTFIFLWLMYDATATRNLGLVKGGVSGSLLFRVLACCALCTVCSLPPTTQFFCEVSLMVDAGGSMSLMLLVLYVFVFMGGLVPLFLVGSLLSRHYDISHGLGMYWGKVFSIFFLVLWSFILFLVC